MEAAKTASLDLRTATADEVGEVMAEGVRIALREHKRAGQSVVIWEEGRVVTVPPDEIEIADSQVGAAGPRA